MTQKTLKKYKWIEIAILVWALVAVVALSVLSAATESDPFECFKLSASSNGEVEISITPNGWTVNAYGTDGSCEDVTETVTFIITNWDSDRAVTFDISVTYAGGSPLSAPSGTQTLAASESLTGFTATSGEGSEGYTTIIISITNIQQESQGTEVTTTIKPGIGGTIEVDGTEVTAQKDFTKLDNEFYTLTATADSGYTFYGWMSSRGPLTIDGGTTYTYLGQNAATLWPLFIKSDSAMYSIKGASTLIYYGYLDEAIAAAGDSGTVVVCRSGTAYHSQSGSTFDITIPENVTLLVPYDDSYTLCTTKPTLDGTQEFGSSTANSRKTPEVFRELTMPTGAHITVNGAISLSGMMCYAQVSNGMPTGATSVVAMESGSSITVNSGGSLYAWGYIVGKGEVTVESGGTVYENFQLRDWRGGTAVSNMLNNTQKVFPASQYYVQNVEVKMTLKAGATENAYMALVASKCFADATIPFIGDNGMFRLQQGFLVKDYLEAEDRLQVDINGDLSMSPLVISAKTTLKTFDLDSEKYVLPITNNLLVNVLSGTTTLSQDMAFLPGSELVIAKGATVSVAEGVSIFVYDVDQWKGQSYVYSNRDDSPLDFVGATWGNPNARPTMGDAKIEVNGTLDASLGYLYTTTGGANVYSTGTGKVITKAGTATVTYQYVQSSGKYVEILITPAKLKNEDGSYVETSSATTATTYNHDHYTCTAHGDTAEDSTKAKCGVWFAGKHEDVIQAAVDATCTVDGKTEGKYCACGSHVEKTQEVISALGHTEVIDAAVAATCTTTGLTEGKHCSVCATVLTAQTVLDQLPHNWSAWEGNSTTFTTTCGHGCADTVVLTLEYRLNDYIWLNAIVDGPVGVALAENTYGYTFHTVNETYYLVRKVHAKEIPTAFTVQFTALNADTPALDISFAAYKTILEAKDTTSDATKTLLTKMEAYGEAAYIYFTSSEKTTYNDDDTKTAPTLTMGTDVDKEMSITVDPATDVEGVTLKTNSARVYFDEALRMSVFFTPTGFDNSKIVKIGLLATPGTGELTVSNHETMYVLYSKTKPEILGGSENYPDAEIKDEVNGTVKVDDAAVVYGSLATVDGRWEVCFDLTNDMYSKAYELRPFVLLDDGSYVYGDQVHYSLAAYISRTYENADKAFKNLLVATWDYVVAADAAF